MQLIRMERAKCAEIERAGCALAHAGGRTVSHSPEQIQIWGAFSPTRHDQTSSHHFHLVSPEFLLTAARAPPKLASHLSRSRARQLIKMLHSPEFKPTLKESMVWKHLGRSHACLYPFLQNTAVDISQGQDRRTAGGKSPGLEWVGVLDVVECESCHGTQSTYHAKCRRECSSGPGRPSIPRKLIVINQVTETEQGLAGDHLSPLLLTVPPPPFFSLLFFLHLMLWFLMPVLPRLKNNC